MRYLFVLMTLLVFFGAVRLGMRTALQPSTTLIIAPGATDIRLIQRRMGEQVIIYQAPGPAYAWRATVERDLAAHGWVPAVWWRTDLPSTFNYLHVSSFWFGAIWDTVELDGEPNVARISVRHWIEVPWRWKRWLLYVSQSIAA
jgi:hypothetical protein